MKIRKPRPLDVINIPMYICKHLFNDGHTHAHRICVGFVIMAFGVFVSKQFHDYAVLHFICDLAGYGIHGMGVVPIIDYISANANDKPTKLTNDAD